MVCNYYDKCKKAQNGKCNKQDSDFCIKEFRLTNLLKHALLSEKQMLEPKLQILKQNIVDENSYMQLKDFYDNVYDNVTCGNSLYIYSSTTGNGKTSWAIKILIRYMSSIWHNASDDCYGLFINVPRFMLALKSYIDDKTDAYIPTIQNNVLNCDVVVWDDIATKNMTEYEKENLLSIINTRIDNGKCNIFTGNVNPSELHNLIGDRLASRISQCKCIGFNGKDMRGISFGSISSN